MPGRPYFLVYPEDQFSKFRPGTGLGSFLQFPLVRMVVALLFFLPVIAANGFVVLNVIEQFEEPLATQIDFARMIFTIPLILLSYVLYCRIVEKREALEISWQGGGIQWLAGALVAAGLVTTYVALISVFGSFDIVEYRSPMVLVQTALAFAMGSLLQEMILLCVVFRLSEELLGTWAALLLSLLVFGIAHAFNPNQTFGSVLFLIVSSVVLIAPYILTRRIWLSWGFHAAWNFTQAGVFGMANSGIEFPGWMVSQVSGPDWLTGGPVGIEGSYVAFAVDLVIGLLVLLAVVRHGRTLKPRWKRRLRDDCG